MNKYIIGILISICCSGCIQFTTENYKWTISPLYTEIRERSSEAKIQNRIIVVKNTQVTKTSQDQK